MELCMALNPRQQPHHALMKGIMKYRLEYFPNPNIVHIHVDDRVTTKRVACGEGMCAFDMKTEEALKNGPSLVKGLLGIRGF